MKKIIKSKNDEKPFTLCHNSLLNDFAKPKYNLELLDDIDISSSQKDMLSVTASVHWLQTRLPKELVVYICQNLLEDCQYAFCTHDRDIYTEEEKNDKGYVIHHIGDLKAPHTHVLLIYNKRTCLSQSAFLFRTFSIKAISRYNLTNEFNYLTHNSKQCKKEHKVLYRDDERICSDIDFFKKRCCDETPKDFKAMLRDFLDGLSVFDLVEKYGNVFILNFKKIEYVANAIKHESLRKHEKLQDHLIPLSDDDFKQLDCF